MPASEVVAGRRHLLHAALQRGLLLHLVAQLFDGNSCTFSLPPLLAATSSANFLTPMLTGWSVLFRWPNNRLVENLSTSENTWQNAKVARMTAILERSFKVLEHLAGHPEGRALSALSAELEMPLSATHRLLSELVRCGYVRQDQSHGDYMLTIKLVSLGLSFLSNSGIVDIAQPMLDRLAASSGELVRLAVVDGDELTFVAKAQGATRGCATTRTWVSRSTSRPARPAMRGSRR
jgi:hypothetical protein